MCQPLNTGLPEPESMFEVMDFMQNSFVRGNSVSEAKPGSACAFLLLLKLMLPSEQYFQLCGPGRSVNARVPRVEVFLDFASTP